MVVSKYWDHHYSRVIATIANMAEGIVEEGMVDEGTVVVEIIGEVGYGETSFLDGSSSTQETKNYVGLVTLSKTSMI